MQRLIFRLACLIIVLPDALPAAAENWSLADPALKACVEKIANKEGWRKIEEVTDIRCHSDKIQSLAGLEVFSALQSLSLHNNEITTINANAWPELQQLNVAKNKLQYLELKDLTNLRRFYAFSNEINTLILENLPQLQQFKANNNDMLTFTYQGLPAIEKIYLFDNELETVDIHNIPALKYMDVRQNPMPDELYEDMDRLNGVTVLHDGNEEDWQ